MALIVSAYLITLTLSLILAAIVFSSNRKSAENLILVAFIVFVSFWIICSFLADTSSSVSTVTFWSKTAIIGPSFVPPLILIFSLVFPSKQLSVKNPILILLFIPSFFISALSQSSLNVEKAVPTSLGANVTPGILYSLFAVVFLVYTIAALYNLINSYRKNVGLKKQQLLYVIWGISISSILAVITNVVLVIAGISSLGVLGPPSFLFFIGMTAYAIVRHKLLDIRLVVLRTVAYSLLIFTLAVIYIGSTILLTNLLFKAATSTGQLIFYSILTLIIAFTFQPLRKFFEHATDKIFFKEDYDQTTLLTELTKITAETILIDDIAHKLLKKILGEMRITKGAFVLTDDGKIFVSETQGYKKEPIFSEKEVFSLQAMNRNLVFEELEEGNEKELLRKLDITVSIPLKTQLDHVGVLLLGEKASGEIYSSKDLKVLEIFSPEAAISFENSKSVEKIRRFNITLKDQVEKATHELKAANEQLKEVDKMKDEFLSIASHDLRTPMAAIKSYLWMALNGRAGEIKNPVLKRYLDVSYSSAERMIALINDLLNVSRIEAGRIQMTFEEIQIKPLIDQVFAEIMSKADEKHIALTYKEVGKIPNVIVDKQRFIEIMQNLIGNALKFTPESGKISIVAEESDKKGFVNISVTDTGVGMSEEDLAKLFTKYGRIESSYSAISASGGTGLGLYISKNYVELSGGKIWVESTVGKGTTFTFSLRVANKELLREMQKEAEKNTIIPVVPRVR